MNIVLPARPDRAARIVMIVPMMSAGKSPHVRYDPSENDVTMDDVVGIGPVRTEVVNTLNCSRLPDVPEHMGGNPRKAILSRPAGNRQDLHGQGDGAGSRRSLPLRVVHRVPVDVLRPDRPQDPQLLKELRQAAREEGGAIGFIEEIDAIAGARSGMRSSPLDKICTSGDPSSNAARRVKASRVW